MAIRIITDSSCDLPETMEEQLDVHVIPMTVSFGEDEYIVGKDINNALFYKLLQEAKQLPKTSQINPSQFEEFFTPYVEAGDSLIVLPISKELSGTYNNALTAAEEFENAEIHVIDTLTTTFGLGLLVTIAVRLKQQGLPAKEIVEKINNIKDKLELYAVINDLKLLTLGGRLSSAGAMVGSLLGIKPIIQVDKGKVVNIDKVRGISAGYKYVTEKTLKKGIDKNYPVFFGHGENYDGVAQLEELINQSTKISDKYTACVGPVVGTHIGFGAAGIAAIRPD